MSLNKKERRQRIKYRIRKRVLGTEARPRMNVYRSNANISVQLIDDVKGNTLVAASSLCKEIAEKKNTRNRVKSCWKTYRPTSNRERNYKCNL